MAEPEFLTTAQVLEFIQIGRTKLWQLVRGGALPAYRIGRGPNGALRFRRRDVLRWLARSRVRPTAPADSSPPPARADG